MAKGITNFAASVHQRLLNKAKESSRPFNEILQYFAIERFIYRLSKSSHADRFILKGALMFSAWCAPASRPTMDIDLLGKIDNRLDTITAAMKDACLIDVEAVEKTFENRNTPVSLKAVIFDPSFGKDGNKNIQWRGFIRKTKLISVPESFEEIVAAMKIFLEPLAAAIVERRTFNSVWTAPGPWR